MQRVIRIAWLGAFAALALAPARARAAELDPQTADAVVAQARQEVGDGFCSAPERPLSRRARALCPLAKDVKGCEGFVAACDEAPPLPKPNESSFAFGKVLSMIANAIVWALLAVAVGILAYFVVRALLRGQRDKQAADEVAARPAVITPEPAAELLAQPTDAEVLLRRANEHAAHGELERAALLYLAAALRALDRGGAIRIARHRTNGEYVRACRDPEAKPELRALVREVDRAQFGHEALTADVVARMAMHAAGIVARSGAAALMILAVVAALGACTPSGPAPKNSDPAGDELLFALLQRQGAEVGRVRGSLATLPMPKKGEKAPLVIVNAARVPMEDEARAHLARWVEAGGRLLLADNVSSWPEGLHAKTHVASSPDVTMTWTVSAPKDQDEDEDEDEDQDEDAPSSKAPPKKSYDAHLAHAEALSWEHASPLAKTADGETYAAFYPSKSGIVVGLANDDLLTNAGLARAPNARALVALLATYAGQRRVEIARPEDGISPPSNPIASLLHAGLGLALAHAAAATLILVLAFGIRQARARAVPPPARRAWTEHIEATGGLYARARLAPHALAAYARFVDGRLRARMPRGHTDPAAFLALRANADPAWCADVWGRATAARTADRPRGDELATLRALSALYAAASKTE